MPNQATMPTPIPQWLTAGREGRVLGYVDEQEGAWVAIALEMDLMGYGATFEKALEELTDLVGMQISFARFKGQPEMIWKNAEPVYWKLFEDVRRDRLHEFVSSFNRVPNRGIKQEGRVAYRGRFPRPPARRGRRS